MYAAIETKGATHIIIHVPHEGSEKSLPALARLLEQNAVFVDNGWQKLGVVKPSTTIHLGDSFDLQNNDSVLKIAASGAVVDETFVNATPEVLTSNFKAIEKAREENARLSNENRVLKDQLKVAEEKIKALAEIHQIEE